MVHYNTKQATNGDTIQSDILSGPEDKSNESSVVIDSSNTTSDDSVQAKDTPPEKDDNADDVCGGNNADGNPNDNECDEGNEDDDDDLEITGVEEAKATVIDETEQENDEAVDKPDTMEQTAGQEQTKSATEAETSVVMQTISDLWSHLCIIIKKMHI